MAMARSLVGLDVHATKIVAAVLDAPDRSAAALQVGRDVVEAAPGCARAVRDRCAPPMRPVRPATGWRASSRDARSDVCCRGAQQDPARER